MSIKLRTNNCTSSSNTMSYSKKIIFRKEANALLKSKYLIEYVNQALGYTITGQKHNRLLSFIIAISYKSLHPLYGLIKGDSSTYISHFIKSVIDFFPIEDKTSYLKALKPDRTEHQVLDDKNFTFLIQLDAIPLSKKEVQEYDLIDYANFQCKTEEAIRLLKPLKVINPFTQLITIPETLKDSTQRKALILNLINTITFLYQRQREMDSSGRIISTKHDVWLAILLVGEKLVTQSPELTELQLNFTKT